MKLKAAIRYPNCTVGHRHSWGLTRRYKLTPTAPSGPNPEVTEEYGITSLSHSLLSLMKQLSSGLVSSSFIRLNSRDGGRRQSMGSEIEAYVRPKKPRMRGRRERRQGRFEKGCHEPLDDWMKRS